MEVRYENSKFNNSGSRNRTIGPFMDRLMSLEKVMTKQLEITDPEATINAAAKRMEIGDVGVLPVCDEKTKVIGMVTDRDLVIRVLAQDKDPKTTKIKEVMTKDIVICSVDCSLEEASHLMEEKKVRRLVVVNRDGAFLGIVSLGDLATDSKEDGLAGEALKKITE